MVVLLLILILIIFIVISTKKKDSNISIGGKGCPIAKFCSVTGTGICSSTGNCRSCDELCKGTNNNMCSSDITFTTSKPNANSVKDCYIQPKTIWDTDLTFDCNPNLLDISSYNSFPVETEKNQGGGRLSCPEGYFCSCTSTSSTSTSCEISCQDFYCGSSNKPRCNNIQFTSLPGSTSQNDCFVKPDKLWSDDFECGVETSNSYFTTPHLITQKTNNTIDENICKKDNTKQNNIEGDGAVDEGDGTVDEGDGLEQQQQPRERKVAALVDVVEVKIEGKQMEAWADRNGIYYETDTEILGRKVWERKDPGPKMYIRIVGVAGRDVWGVTNHLHESTRQGDILRSMFDKDSGDEDPWDMSRDTTWYVHKPQPDQYGRFQPIGRDNHKGKISVVKKKSV